MNPIPSIPGLKYPHSRSQITIFVVVFLCFCHCTAQSSLDSLKVSFEQEENDSIKIIYGIQLAREIHRKEHNEETEYYYAQDAIKKALNFRDTLLYARTLDNLGLLHRYHQNYNESMDLHIKAYKLVENEDIEPIYKMIFANNAGVASRYNQKYDSAILYYMEALKIAEEEDNLRNIAISTNGIGNVLGNIPGREDKALVYFERSLEAEEKRGNSLGIAMNYLSISDYYTNEDQFEKGREYLGKLLEINQERNDHYGLAITYEFYGRNYLAEAEDLGRAASYFQNALDRFKKLGDVHRQAELLVSLGNVHLEQNRPMKAQEFFLNSLALGKKLDHYGLIMTNSLYLSELYEEEKEPVKALHYFKQGKIYEDSIKLSEQNVEIAALIRKYNIEKKENHIQLLQKDKALQQTLLENQRQQLDRRQIFIVLMGIGLLFILIIFLLQYRYSQTKKKTDVIIQKEEKEKMKAIYERNLAQAEILVTRLRINPHFLFNSLNAIKYLIQSEQNTKAMKYLVIFSRYTRMVLETSQKHVVPLSEEVKLTHYYLTLEENRFEKDFTYEIMGADAKELEDILIPPLLLQPFIENAIQHGLLPSKRDKKKVLLQLVPHEEGIKIIIDDNGVGRGRSISQNSHKAHKSMGIEIIDERIELYNKSYTSSISYGIIDKKNPEGNPEGTRIVFDLVQKKDAQDVSPNPVFANLSEE